MIRFCRALVYVVASAALGATGAAAACPPNADATRWIDAGDTCLAISVAGGATAGAPSTLVLLIHGDVADGGPADYLYPFARAVAKPGVVAVALLRPGYFDASGRTSEGSNDNRRDNYTVRTVTIVGAAVAALKQRYKARRVVVMGHSGGAAIAGVLIGRQPGLIDAAVLVSCPCDVPRWRAERKKTPWANSLSPHEFAAAVPRSTIVVAIAGTNDGNTRPALADAYVGMLSERGVNATTRRAQGAGHGFNRLAPTVLVALQQLL
jgi:pimeloyl-ACP methyl ester carboxylesterase